MIDSRVVDAIAAGTVPANVSAVYLSESRDQGSIVGIIFVTALTFLFVCARLVSRALIVRRVGVDDGLALISMACLIAFVGLTIELIRLGSGRHFEFIQYVLDVPTVLKTQYLDFAAHIIYTTALLLCRVSGLAFYHRICSVHAGFSLAIKIVFGILIAGFLPQIFLLIFHCSPVTGYWPYGWEPIADQYVCLQWGVVYSVNSSVSLLCDLLLFGIPVAMLRILEMPAKRKVQLGCILLPGIAVIAISIARLVLVIRGQWETDMSWSYNPMLGVEVSEIGATLIALSVPGAKPLVDKYILKKVENSHTGASSYGQKPTSRSRATKMSTLRLHSQHSILGSQDDADSFGAEAVASSGYGHNNSNNNDDADGIYVRVDFDVKQEARVQSQNVDKR